ncbi:hypothetical protein FNP_1615 [Fusobacterium polymorphum ATCC 10953]|uniref:Uncharacterized protein n=2 Tax=Fusobacterium nucleatum subsp. polymorphum TaxID=76857 RepID=A5TWW6_FUSNP|nr:hypothetical protein FNP_1615 [Fusobacterium polymorphum ATCC 10953]
MNNRWWSNSIIFLWEGTT